MNLLDKASILIERNSDKVVARDETNQGLELSEEPTVQQADARAKVLLLPTPPSCWLSREVDRHVE